MAGRIFVILLLLSVLGLFLNWTRPAHNWDMIGYVGASLQLSGAPREEIHRRTYAIVQAAVSDSSYALLTRANPYRRTVAADPEAFAQQLPYYSSKPAYVLLVTLGTKLGLDPVAATVVIARLAYLALGLSVWWWLQGMIGPVTALGPAALTMAMPGVLVLGRSSVPDGLSVLITFNGVLLALAGQRVVLGCALLLFALPVRLDNAVWVGLTGVCLALDDRRRLLPLGLWAAAGALVVVSIEHWSGFYGWRHLMYTNFIDRLPYPAHDPTTIGFGQYVAILVREAHPVHLPPSLALFSLLGGLVVWARARSLGWRDPWTQLAALSAAFLVLHFLVFPDQERFFVTAYLVILLALVHTLHCFGSGGTRSDDPASGTSAIA